MKEPTQAEKSMLKADIHWFCLIVSTPCARIQVHNFKTFVRVFLSEEWALSRQIESEDDKAVPNAYVHAFWMSCGNGCEKDMIELLRHYQEECETTKPWAVVKRECQSYVRDIQRQGHIGSLAEFIRTQTLRQDLNDA